jgi:hypothetical protein
MHKTAAADLVQPHAEAVFANTVFVSASLVADHLHCPLKWLSPLELTETRRSCIHCCPVGSLIYPNGPLNRHATCDPGTYSRFAMTSVFKCFANLFHFKFNIRPDTNGADASKEEQVVARPAVSPAHNVKKLGHL